MRLSIEITKQNAKDMVMHKPHLIEEFFFCKRQFFLHMLNFYNQDNETLSIGRALHDKKQGKEIPVKVDRIDWDDNQIIEFKKNDFSIGAILQAYIYLKKMSMHNGSVNSAIIRSIEKRKKKIIKYPDEKLESDFDSMIIDMSKLKSIPQKEKTKSACSRCSFFEYCWV